MKSLMIIFFISTFFFSNGFCQQSDTLIRQEDSLAKEADTENPPITFSTYFTLLGSDLKQQFTAPFHQTGREWLRIAAYTAGMATISQLVDEPVQRFALRIKNSSVAAGNISGYVTRFGDPYDLYI